MKIRLGVHPIIKIMLATALFFGLVGAGVFTYFYVYFSRVIDRRLNGPIFANTSRIYAAPTPVFVGEERTTAEIATALRRAGYSEVKTNTVGWYHMVPGGIEVFPGQDSYFQAEAGLIKINGRKVERIVSLGDNTDRQRYDLEPEVITNLFDHSRSKRRLVRYEDLPANLINAVLAIEDKNFFKHSGIDFLRVGKAAYDDLRGKKLSGASTLSMQFAGGYFLDRRDRSWHRKLPEAMITLVLEQRYSKSQLFEMYMNQVNFGQRGSFSIDGIGEASLAYFDKDIKQLSLPEAALLAGMINGPSVLSPYRHPDRARQRRNLVLDAMLSIGAVTQEQHDAAVRAPLGVVPAQTDTGDAPYFVDMVKEQMLEKYSEKDLTSSTYRIYTGLDLDLQRIATEAIQTGIKEPEQALATRFKKRKFPELQAALICIDPHTGAVLAMQGGRSYGASQLNRVVAKRQPGSSFKPLVYAAAFNSAIDGSKPLVTPATVVIDEPTVFTFEHGTQTYSPDNFHETFGGRTTLRDALAHSYNVATIKVGEMIGFDKVVALAHAAGIKNAEPTPSVAIGSYDATPLEMAGAYTIFANKGEYVEPTLVRLVKAQDGQVLEEHQPEPKQVLDPRVAYLMTNLMENVMLHGTAAQVRTRGFDRPAAGKTGSSRDAWFAGYTSNLLVIVWTGFDDNTNLPLTGAQSALPIWVEFMKKAVNLRRYRDTMPFPPPPGIVQAEVDPETGMLATAMCPTHRTEIFIEGGEPTQPCPAHSGGSPLRSLAGFFGLPGAAPPPALRPPQPMTSPNVIPGGSTTQSQANGTSTPPSTADDNPDQPKKRRGFFSRLFGGGGGDKPKDPANTKPKDSKQN